MRVYDVNLNSTSAAESGRAQESQKVDRAGIGGAAATSGAGSGDHVEFSTTLGQLSQALTADGSDRAGRIQALAAQYQSGGYQPDSLATSRAMITDALAAKGE